ncbi:unnamed protein product [Paramecium sonneborni]|uniref:Protein kinase domain-containing protein n=1 Tax=Paramecium sonneborni TaxID=65129 RepID=A0A8S1QMQ8_9CILI|nr:unnamed protein product [Paramecium sonneborni]
MGCTSSIEQTTMISNKVGKPKLRKSMSTSSIICYKNSKIRENITILNQGKSQLDCQFITQVLKKHYIFYQLNEESIQNIIKHMFYCLIKQNHHLYQNINTPSCMFLVDKGQLKNQNFTLFQPGSIVAEDNLLLGQIKFIEANVDTYMWGLDRIQFNKAIQYITSQSFVSNRAFLQQQYLFQYFSQNQLDGIAANILQVQYSKNQVMFSDDAYVIIKNGEASLFKGNQFSKTLSRRDTYGTLYKLNKPKNTKVKAVVETQCLILTQAKLIEVIGFNIQKQIYQAIIRYVLIEIELPGLEIEKILEKEYYKLKIYNDETIRQKQIHEDLSIIVDGTVNCEGETLRLGEFISDQFDNSVYIANGTIAIIQREYLYIEDYIIEENSDDEQIKYKPRFSELKQLQIMRRNGNNVINLVQFKQQNYILRQINKYSQQKTQQDRRMKQQKKILEILKSPHISKYYQFYEDNASYYFLLKYIDGTLLSERRLKLPQIQTAILQIISILEVCYKNSVICRSIKLDNFLIDYQGNVYLINLLNAKQASRTYTIIGSPHYMAPEILEGRGYDCNSDVWSLGICLYELLFEQVPYGQALDDPYQIYEEIIGSSNIEFPESYKDEQGKSLMKQLINKNVYQRIGSNFDQLKNHCWFSQLDIENISPIEPAFELRC